MLLVLKARAIKTPGAQAPTHPKVAAVRLQGKVKAEDRARIRRSDGEWARTVKADPHLVSP